jgi:hypothetical protein
MDNTVETTTEAPMTRDELAAWLRLHGTPEAQLQAAIIRNIGNTETQMEGIVAALHGDMA